MITVSAHAIFRWFKRSDAPRIGPVKAWEEGQPVDGTALNGDEIRYHCDSATLLVRKDHTIVTVADADRARPATREAIAALEDGDDSDDVDPTLMADGSGTVVVSYADWPVGDVESDPEWSYRGEGFPLVGQRREVTLPSGKTVTGEIVGCWLYNGEPTSVDLEADGCVYPIDRDTWRDAS